jgi:hypothetical protein
MDRDPRNLKPLGPRNHKGSGRIRSVAASSPSWWSTSGSRKATAGKVIDPVASASSSTLAA